jgi:hypothetical protein
MSEVKGPSKEDEAKWKAESDLRTLIEAARIRNDKERSANVMKMAQEQRAELDKLSKGKGNAK